jgi:serine/threonine-protein kinase HipA
MPRSTDELTVHLGDTPVATVRRSRRGLELRYEQEVVDRATGRPVVSCSLPVGRRPIDATAFFDGVLPEGRFRSELAARAELVASDTYGMLQRYGRDIAGALSLTNADGTGGTAPGLVRLTSSELETEVEALPDRPLGIHEDSELSIPGLQDKLLLVELPDGGWGRPTGGRPSTHIVKLDSGTHPGVVRAEHEAMRLALSVGLTTVTTELKEIAGKDCLFVERFDRTRTASGEIVRVHQEDGCQALGRSPEQKYELRTRGSRRGGGPEFVEIAGLLDRFVADPAAEHVTLVRIATFTALIGNCDAHGKNLALLHDNAHDIGLAPLYDTVPTVLFPSLKNEAAMTIGGTLDLAKVRCSTIVREARSWRMNPDVAATAACELVAEITHLVGGSGTALADVVQARCDRFDDR